MDLTTPFDWSLAHRKCSNSNIKLGRHFKVEYPPISLLHQITSNRKLGYSQADLVASPNFAWKAPKTLAFKDELVVVLNKMLNTRFLSRKLQREAIEEEELK